MPTEVSLENLSDDQIKSLAAIQLKLYRNPKTQKHLLELYAEESGTVPPELEAHRREDSLRTEIEKDRDERKRERQEDILRRDREILLSQLLEEGIVASRAEFEEVEKFGTEQKIGDYRNAAKYYRLSRETAEPSAIQQADLGPSKPPEMPGLKDFGGNIHAAAQAEAFKALGEIRSGKLKLPA